MSTSPASIVFTDIDGTLVDADHHAIPADAPVIQRVAKAVPFCLVSARPPEGLRPIQRELGFTGPIASYSGAYVLDHEGNELYSSTIPIDVAIEAKALVEAKMPSLVIGTYSYEDWIVDSREDERIKTEEFYVKFQARECSDMRAAFGDHGVHKLLVMGEPADILAVEDMLGQRYPELNVVRSNATLCEVMTKEASKSRAVQILCERYGTTPAEALAFGDGPNDLDMLNAVATSCAVANAEDSVKLAASRVLPWSNVESGVARALDELFA